MKEKFNEADIRPDNLWKDQEEAINKDVKWLLQYKDKFENVECPACGSKHYSLEYNKKEFNYVRCNYCSTVYVNPRPSATILKDFYTQSEVYKYWTKNVYSKKAEGRKKFIFSPRAKLLEKKCTEAGFTKASILEVGSSSGFFLEEIGKLEYFDKVVGIELTPDQAAESRKKGIDTFETSYETFNSKNKFTAIASFETIEHLYSPRNFMLWARDNLCSRGFLMITCPNYGGIEPLALGSDSICVDHEHINYFNPSSFRILCNKTGFDNIEISTPGLLDLKLMSNALKENKSISKKLGKFLTNLIESNDDTLYNDFQDFLQHFNLSSNMLIIARKSD